MILKQRTENQPQIKKAPSEEQINTKTQDIALNGTLERQASDDNEESSIRIIDSADSVKLKTTNKQGSVGRTDTDLKIDIQLPIKVEKSLIKIVKFLTQYEIEEIQNYDMIYFIDLDPEYVKRKLRKQKTVKFDDDAGDYRLLVGEQIAYRYEIIDRYLKQYLLL
jgi:hypothetical protein